MSLTIGSPSAELLAEDSTTPLFESFFAGARFFDEPQEGGGVYAAGQEEGTNILIFSDEISDGNDVAVGGNEIDILMAGAGNDNFNGAGGTDFVFGGFGDDIVRGGTGDDVVVGNEGSDLAISGEGADVYEFFASQFVEGETDTLLDFDLGSDSIVIVGSTDVSVSNVGGTTLLSIDEFENAIAFRLDATDSLNVVTRTNSTVLF
ncbi:MAG: calcium-binding protein [Cyanophyceae cyanobacterium]